MGVSYSPVTLILSDMRRTHTNRKAGGCCHTHKRVVCHWERKSNTRCGRQKDGYTASAFEIGVKDDTILCVAFKCLEIAKRNK